MSRRKRWAVALAVLVLCAAAPLTLHASRADAAGCIRLKDHTTAPGAEFTWDKLVQVQNVCSGSYRVKFIRGRWWSPTSCIKIYGRSTRWYTYSHTLASPAPTGIKFC